LTELFNDPDWRVALVTGAPASGKTITVAQWFRSLGGVDREWVSLSARENQPERFWLVLAAAANRARSGGCERSETIAGHSEQDRQPLIDQLVEDLSADDEPVVLVIDDVHHLREPSTWLELEMLIERLPAHVQLVLTSRTDPPIPKAAWKARLWLLDVRQRQLDFTLPETRLLFVDSLYEGLADTDVEELWRHTGGWAAALRLALTSVRQSADPKKAVEEISGRNRAISDLLVTDVLEPQTEETRTFLLMTSFLDVLDAELCDAVTKRDDSAATLRRLESELQFLAALDSDGSKYRCHPLFAEVLRAELDRTMPGVRSKLCQLAGEYQETRGDIVGAVSYYLEAGETDQAFLLIADSAFDRSDRGDVSGAAAWVELLSPELVELNPAHMLTYAMMLAILGRMDEGLAWLARAQLIIEEEPEAYARERALVDAMLLMGHSINGIAEGGIETGQRAVAALEQGFHLGFPGHRARPNLARAYLLADQPAEAEQVLNGGPLGDEVAQLLLGPAVGARVALRNGALGLAEERATVALAGATALGMESQTGALDALLARGGVFAERLKLDAAHATFARLDRDSRSRKELVAYHVLGRTDRVRLLAARGTYDEALSLIAEMRDLMAGRDRSALHTVVDGLAARWLLETGEATEAQVLIGGLPEHWFSHRLLEARLDLVKGHRDAAIAALSRLSPMTPRDQLSHLLLLARVHLAMDHDAAMPILSEAVDVAIGEGFVLPFLEEGSELTRLARSLVEDRPTLAASHLAEGLGAPIRVRTKPQPSILLTDREAAVLRFLPTLLTNQEIAKECFMSVNTVKTHLKSLYAKLDVSSRSAAVQKARGEGLLPS
jgi:LuxR family maltose regulon positive regulatory protein